MLVFDNADAPAVLAAHRSGSPADAGWLRPDQTGMVIVTTRIIDPQALGNPDRVPRPDSLA